MKNKTILTVIGVIALVILGLILFSANNGNLFQGAFLPYQSVNPSAGFSYVIPSTAVYNPTLQSNSENKLIEFNLSTPNTFHSQKGTTPKIPLILKLSSNTGLGNVSSCQLSMVNPSDNSTITIDQIGISDFSISKDSSGKTVATIPFNLANNNYLIPANVSVRFQISCTLTNKIAGQSLQTTLSSSQNNLQGPAISF